MMMKTVAGIALIFIGFALIGNVFKLSTIYYPQCFWYLLSPSGTQSSPTVLTAGQNTALSVAIVYTDPTAGINFPLPQYWTVTATISASGYSAQTITLTFYQTTTASCSGHTVYIGQWGGTWATPSQMNVLYTFSWVANIKDASGGSYGTQQTATYGQTADLTPDGYFSINGQSVSSNTNIIVTSPTLSIGFTPTKNANQITSITVNVYHGSTTPINTLTLTKQADGTYSTTYTLPGYGTYGLVGDINWNGQQLPKMSILTQWGSEPTGLGIGISMNQLLGIISVLLGIWFLYPWRRR